MRSLIGSACDYNVTVNDTNQRLHGNNGFDLGALSVKAYVEARGSVQFVRELPRG